MRRFAALDFETANPYRDSACALAVVVATRTRILRRGYWLIRPPTSYFTFTYIHGITWEDVRDEPTFEQCWPEIQGFLEGVDFLAAHNAPFDRSVLHACCARYGLPRVETPFVCTVQLSRQLWDIRPTRLPDVCGYLDIPLDHHRAESDAEACARIVMAAVEAGWSW